MLDDGSTLSFINHQAALRLNLPMERTFCSVLGHDGTRLNPVYWKTDLVIQNSTETLSSPIYVQSVCVASGGPIKLPVKSFDVSDERLRKLKLADPQFNVSSPVYLLLGGVTWAEIKKDKSIKLQNIRLQNTIFGYVVQGRLPTISTNQAVTATVGLADIQRDLQQVFEYQATFEEDDAYAESLFVKHHRRLADGRYEVPLVYYPGRELGTSYNICFARNKRTFEKLSEKQIEQFLAVIKDYEDQGIITIKPNDRAESFITRSF